MASRVLTMCNRSGSQNGNGNVSAEKQGREPCRASRGVELMPKMRRCNWLWP
ncbi:hypothetical protein BCR44DRAFT_1447835, partial [Catenaria anguillulae PL171]